MPEPKKWLCPVGSCETRTSRFHELWNNHLLKGKHPKVALSRIAYESKDYTEFYEYKALHEAHSQVILGFEALDIGDEMEREKRNRVPTAKAAEYTNTPKPVDAADLPITTPEWKNLPTDDDFFKPANEVPKINPVTKTSSTTREQIKLYHFGQHLESKDKFHYSRAKGDPATGLFHNTEAPPYYARISDETHPLCNITEFNMDFLVSKDMLTCFGRGAHRTAKANVCVREGTYFYEAKVKSCIDDTVPLANILQHQKNLAEGNPIDKARGDTLAGSPRIGFARREHPQGASLGATGYSYALSCYGTKSPLPVVCCGKPVEFEGMPEIKENDVIGFMITLPSLDEHRRIVTAERNSDDNTKAKQNSDSTNAASSKAKKNKKGKDKKKAKATDKSTPAPAPGPSTDPAAPSLLPEIPSTVDIIHERYPIRAKGGIYYESSEYLMQPELRAQAGFQYEKEIKKIAAGREIPRQGHEMYNAPPDHDWPTLRGLPGSKIEVWVNGKYIGVAVKNLLAFLPPASVVDVQKKSSLPPNMHSGLWDDGTLGYYPAVSNYSDSMVEFKFAEPFWFGHDGRVGAKPVEARYTEAIVDDFVSDLIDEVQWEVEHRTASSD